MGALKSPRRRKYACSECTMRPSTVAEAAVSACPSTWPPNTCGLPISRLSPRKRFTSSGSSSSSRSRSASWRFIACALIGNAQSLVHYWTGGGVLEELPLLRIEVVLDAEGGERRLVKARQDELFLAGIGVDVTHREDSRQARLEPLGVDLQGLLLELEPPFGDGPELGMQAEEDQQVVRLERVQRAVRRLDVDTPQRPVRRDQRMRQRLEQAHAAGRDQLLHPGHRGRSRAKLRPPVHEGHASRPRRQLQRPVEGRIAAAEDDEPLALECADVLH